MENPKILTKMCNGWTGESGCKIAHPGLHQQRDLYTIQIGKNSQTNGVVSMNAQNDMPADQVILAGKG